VTQRPPGETEIKKSVPEFALQHHPGKNVGDDDQADSREWVKSMLFSVILKRRQGKTLVQIWMAEVVWAVVVIR
jgi:hypothetical protein